MFSLFLVSLKKLMLTIFCLDCPCAGERPASLDGDDDEYVQNVTPYATNGEIFPWNNPRLPTFARPTRYHINIHPNLTTMDVKGR